MMQTSLKLLSGESIPMLGLGTWTAPPGTMKTVIFSALKAGYRHIDAAFLYGNEKDIGEALEESMKKLNIQREDIFITTKCWCTHLRPEYVRKCCQMSLSDLRLPYVDLYLIHWPVAFQHSDVSFPRASNGHDFLLDDVPLLDTWKAMENLVDDGMVRAIGLSNFNRRQIDTIMNGARIKPVNLQIEINANFPNTKLVEYAQASGLTVTAYAPLGSPSAAVWKDVIQGFWPVYLFTVIKPIFSLLPGFVKSRNATTKRRLRSCFAIYCNEI
ncbi:hypothetical protein CRM22_002509 [Opisthorchis felineus]|uniref:NADP-dependent oxidoreductase domain-containing protein n=1 Tax=Opisthorchis felineus TaxID=147828 RepID=A0A4S2M5Q6_OPIFE|nr:hypothetical protein CRM22_002509 [Opisthorchis felineus]